MKISDESTETLQMIIQSWFAARGENFDEISCPKLKAVFNEIMKTPTDKNAERWVHENCKFSSHQKTAILGWIAKFINPAQIQKLKQLIGFNVEQAKQFALQIANKMPGGAANACQIANVLLGEAAPGMPDILPCQMIAKTQDKMEKLAGPIDWIKKYISQDKIQKLKELAAESPAKAQFFAQELVRKIPGGAGKPVCQIVNVLLQIAANSPNDVIDCSVFASNFKGTDSMKKNAAEDPKQYARKLLMQQMKDTAMAIGKHDRTTTWGANQGSPIELPRNVKELGLKLWETSFNLEKADLDQAMTSNILGDIAHSLPSLESIANAVANDPKKRHQISTYMNIVKNLDGVKQLLNPTITKTTPEETAFKTAPTLPPSPVDPRLRKSPSPSPQKGIWDKVKGVFTGTPSQASVKIKINKYASGWINTPTLPGQMFKSKEELVKAVNDIEDRNPKNPFHETPTSIYYNAVRFIWQNKKKTPTRETPTSF